MRTCRYDDCRLELRGGGVRRGAACHRPRRPHSGASHSAAEPAQSRTVLPWCPRLALRLPPLRRIRWGQVGTGCRTRGPVPQMGKQGTHLIASHGTARGGRPPRGERVRRRKAAAVEFIPTGGGHSRARRASPFGHVVITLRYKHGGILSLEQLNRCIRSVEKAQKHSLGSGIRPHGVRLDAMRDFLCRIRILSSGRAREL